MPDATLSEVLEETYHFSQNLRGLNADKNIELRTILNEIDAKQYLLENARKYGITRIENEETWITISAFKPLIVRFAFSNFNGKL